MGIIRHAFTKQSFLKLIKYVQTTYGSHTYLTEFLEQKFNGKFDSNGWGGVSFNTEKEYTWFILHWA
jgi:hypothetical protein